MKTRAEYAGSLLLFPLKPCVHLKSKKDRPVFPSGLSYCSCCTNVPSCKSDRRHLRQRRKFSELVQSHRILFRHPRVLFWEIDARTPSIIEKDVPLTDWPAICQRETNLIRMQPGSESGSHDPSCGHRLLLFRPCNVCCRS